MDAWAWSTMRHFVRHKSHMDFELNPSLRYEELSSNILDHSRPFMSLSRPSLYII